MSKTGKMDDTVVIDEPLWLGAPVARQCENAGPLDLVFPMPSEEAVRPFRLAAACLWLLDLCLYRLRHGGASEDVLGRLRDVEEVQARESGGCQTPASAATRNPQCCNDSSTHWAETSSGSAARLGSASRRSRMGMWLRGEGLDPRVALIAGCAPDGVVGAFRRRGFEVTSVGLQPNLGLQRPKPVAMCCVHLQWRADPRCGGLIARLAALSRRQDSLFVLSAPPEAPSWRLPIIRSFAEIMFKGSVMGGWSASGQRPRSRGVGSSDARAANRSSDGAKKCRLVGLELGTHPARVHHVGACRGSAAVPRNETPWATVC